LNGMLGNKCAGLGVVIAAILIIGGIPIATLGDTGQGNEPAGTLYLKVGEPDKMKSRNPLPAISDDTYTHDVLDRVYDTVGKSDPATDELKPYILKGIDANENGVFDASEYGKVTKNVGTNPLDIIAYYDFNGVYFHDGVQANASDLYFSYQLSAMNPRMNDDVRVLMDRAGKAGSNYSVTRWLFVVPALKNWQNEPPVGDPNLRIAVRFLLQDPYALFAHNTLAGLTLFPRHVWEDSGWREGPSGPVLNLHLDFGKAIYPETDSRFGRGIPTTETLCKPFEFFKPATPEIDSAEEWEPTDDDVIGSGPFAFDSFNEISAVVTVLKFADYYTGNDSKSMIVIDPYVSTYIHLPYIDGVIFVVYASVTLGVLAIQAGDIDMLRAPIPPEYLPALLNNPNIRIWYGADPGFTYLGYNMRRPAIGTWHYGQVDQFDIGLHFRRAIAHLVNKTMIYRDYLQGYGIPGVVPLSPANVRYYNSSLAGYQFSVTQALAEMDLAHQDALWLSTHGGGPGTDLWYTKDPGTGFFILPGIGTSEFDLLCPNADNDPVKANSCVMIANEMSNLGINVKAKPSAPSAVRAYLNAHDFDMYIWNWEIRTNDPGYLYNLFHSSNAAAGRNYGGFNDPLMDLVLEDSQKEMDPSLRVMLIQWAQAILLEKLPYDTLYFRTNIEAQRQDQFVGWYAFCGSIFNYWSLLFIRPPSNNRLSVDLQAPSAMYSGDATSITVTVRNQNGEFVDGAKVTVYVTPHGYGNLTDGVSPPNDTYVGYASQGRLILIYFAPTISFVFNVTIEALAEYPGYPDEGDYAMITIWPLGVDFLSVMMSATPDTIPPLGTSEIRILVTDGNGFPVIDAYVTVDVSPWLPPPYGVVPDQGLSNEMEYVTFYAPPASYLPLDFNLFTITARANHTGDFDGESSTTITVIKSGDIPPLASFTVTPPTGGTSTLFDFDASACSDAEDPPSALQVRWDWENDGRNDTQWSYTKTAQHQYSTEGIYTVRLEVIDANWSVNSTTRQVTVTSSAIPPIVSIASPTQWEVVQVTPITVTGNAVDNGGSGLNKVEVRVNGGSWFSAVGTVSWTASADLQYGSNVIEARALDNHSLYSQIASVTIAYNTPPEVDFTISPTSGDTNTLFAMTITASDAQDRSIDLRFRWDWENDGTWDTAWSTNPTATHQYAHFGTYSMKVEVNDTGGLKDSAMHEVRVSLAPPINVDANTGGSLGTMDIAWNHSTPDDVDHYHIAVYDSADSTEPIQNETVTDSELHLTGLEPGKTYWFDVVAADADGNTSNPSERVSGIAGAAQPSGEFPWVVVMAGIIIASIVAVAVLMLQRRRKKEPEEAPKEEAQ